MTTYYISGKITPTHGESQLDNLEQFNLAEEILQNEGHLVFNPARLEVEGGAPWEWYLARDLKYIFENRPVLYMLKGWEDSRGARLEKELAELLGLEIVIPS